jgi:probable HAF family extracellular repeat protein
VVGSAQDATGHERPVRWDGDGVTNLGTLGGPEGAARAINASGQIVGWAETADGARRAVLWDDGAIVDLGMTSDDSIAIDINDAGQILIVSGSTVPERAALWEDGVLWPIEPGSGAFVLATAINNRGDVVGLAATDDGQARGFMLVGGVPSDIVAPDGLTWLPTAVGNDGAVAGVVVPADDDAWSTAAIWRDGDEFRLMPDAVGMFSTPMAVNDRNIVAGWVQIGGDERAVVWVPVAALLPDDG